MLFHICSAKQRPISKPSVSVSNKMGRLGVGADMQRGHVRRSDTPPSITDPVDMDCEVNSSIYRVISMDEPYTCNWACNLSANYTKLYFC